MVKTRRQYSAMASEQNVSTPQQSEQTESDNMAASSIEQITPETDKNTATSIPATYVNPQTENRSTDFQGDWLSKFEALLKIQIHNLQTATKTEINNLQMSMSQQQAAMNTQIFAVNDQISALTEQTKQHLDRLEQQQTKTQAEIEKLESAQQQLHTRISQEVTEQLNRQMNRVEEIINSRFTTVQQKVVDEIMGTVEARMQDCQETIRTIPTTIDQLSQNLSELKIRQETIETTVERITTHAENIVKENQERVQQFLNNTEAELNDRIDSELSSVIKNVAEKVYEEHGTTVKALQEDLTAVKSMLASQTKTTPTFPPVINVPQTPVPVQNVANNIRFPDSQASMNSNMTPERQQNDYQLTTACELGRSGREMLPQIHTTERSQNRSGPDELEDSMVKHHQFQVFINEKRTVHPVIFIQSFRGLLPENWSEKRKIRFVVGYIQGEAGIWANEAWQTCDTYAEFERAFLSTYWSPVVQERFRNEVYNPQPFDDRNGSLRRYFEKYLNKAKFFDDPLPYKEVLRVLINKLPTYLRLQLANVPTQNLEKFLAMLDTLDLIFDDDRGQRNFKINNNGYGNGNQYIQPFNNQLLSVGPPPPIKNQNRVQPQQMLLPHPFGKTNGRPRPPQQLTTYDNGNSVVHNVPNGGQYYRRRSDNRYNPGYFHNNNYNNNSYNHNDYGNGYRNKAVAHFGNFNRNQQQPRWRNQHPNQFLNQNQFSPFNGHGNFLVNNSNSGETSQNFSQQQRFRNFPPQQSQQQQNNTVPIATMTIDSAEQTNWPQNQPAVTITDVTETTNPIATQQNSSTQTLN